jgi:WS/DGAT/MGAT family acyltransferase
VYDPSTAPEPVTFTGILRAIEHRLHLARSFRQRMVRVPLDLDHPYWIEDADFDLEFHIRHLRLPQPGDWRQLCIQVARLHSRALDFARPPWELYVLEGLDDVEGIPAGSFALVLKLHHSAIDGAAGVEITNAIHDLAPDATRAEPALDWQPDAQPSAFNLLCGAIVHLIERPVRLIRLIGRDVPIVGRLPLQLRRQQFSLPPLRMPYTRFNETVTGHRVMEARSFPLDAFRSLKSALPGATVNDVGLAVISGALRLYLLAKGDLPETPLGAVCPISLRSRDEAKAAAGNDIASMAVSLHTHIEDAFDRFEAICATTSDAKERKRAIGARTLVELSELLPGALLGIGFRAQARLARTATTALLFNISVTNVPASPVPLYFNGARMVATYGLGPVFDGMGLLHLVVSYAGVVSITITSDRKMMPDPAFYACCIQQSYEELLDAAGPRAT